MALCISKDKSLMHRETYLIVTVLEEIDLLRLAMCKRDVLKISTEIAFQK